MTNTKEKINGSQEWFECLCGNTAEQDGFFSCDINGSLVSPDLDGEWDEIHYICSQCERVINGDTLEVDGVKK